MKVSIFIRPEHDDERHHVLWLLQVEGASIITDLDDLAQDFTEQARETLQYSGLRLDETTIEMGWDTSTLDGEED